MKWATLATGLLIAGTTISADLGYAEPLLHLIGKVPFGDEMCHFFMACLFCLLLCATLAGSGFGQKVPWAVAALFLAATAEEFSQRWIEGRTFSLSDLACNYLGVALAGVAVVCWSARDSKTNRST